MKKVILMVSLVFLNISCAFSNSSNLSRKYFEGFFNESYIEVKKTNSLKLFSPESIYTVLYKDTIFRLEFNVKLVEKMLFLRHYKGKTIIIGKYIFDPKLNINRMITKVSLPIVKGEMELLVWVKTLTGKYYHTTNNIRMYGAEGYGK